MDLRQLEILKAVAETGSFTGAGRRLHVSQSAISRQILLLEAELNEPLFWRIKRKVKITPAGESLLQLAIRVFDDIRETTERLSETQQKLSGTIRLVGGMTVSIYVFPALLKEFQRLHPDVDVKVMTGPADRLVRRLRAGTVDLGLLTLPVTEPDLITQPVMREDLLLVTYPGHPLTQKKKIETSDLNKLPFILYEPGSNTRRVIDEFFVREQVSPRIVMETENVEIIKAMASQRHRRDDHLEPCDCRRSESRHAGRAPHQQPVAGARDRVGVPQGQSRAAQDQRDDPRARRAAAEDGIHGIAEELTIADCDRITDCAD